jgi:hypothetical protein
MRLMLQKAICTIGEEAARMFYQPDRFTRKHAMAITGLMLLQDKGSAHVLDAPRTYDGGLYTPTKKRTHGFGCKQPTLVIQSESETTASRLHSNIRTDELATIGRNIRWASSESR